MRESCSAIFWTFYEFLGQFFSKVIAFGFQRDSYRYLILLFEFSIKSMEVVTLNASDYISCARKLYECTQLLHTFLFLRTI